MDFKKSSAFKDDKFKYESEDFTPEEMKELERKGFDPEVAKKIQEEKDLKFMETMEDDSRAADYVESVETLKMKRAQKLKEEVADYVDMAKGGSYSSYKVNLAEWGMWLLMQKNFPKGYEYHCIPTKPGDLNIYGRNFETKDGVLFVLKDKQGRVYIKAMGISLDTMADVTSVQLLAVEVENTIDAIEGTLESIDSNKVVDDAVKKILGPDGKPL